MSCWPKARIVVVCLLALAAPVWSASEMRRGTSVDIRALPLLDQDGKPTSLRAFEGRTLVLHFIFTRCAAACHLQVRSLGNVRDSLPVDTRTRTQFVSVSLDPEQDTPEALRRYATEHGIVDPGWRFATASADVIDQLTRSFGITRRTLSDGQIDHTLAVLLIDASGRLMQRYTGPDLDTARLAHEIGEVVRLFGGQAAR